MIRRQMTAGVVRQLNYTPDARELVVQDGDSATWWDWRKGTERQSLSTHSRVVFSPDHKRAAVSGYYYDVDDCHIHLRSGRTLRKQAALEVSSALGMELTFTSDGRQLLAGSGDCEVSFWDVRQRQALHRFFLERSAVAVACSPEGTRLATMDPAGELHLWSPDDPSSCEKQRLGAIRVAESRQMLFLDEKTLAIAGENAGSRGVSVWDTETGKTQYKLKGLKAKVNGLALSPGGKLLATVGKDAHFHLWERASGRRLQSCECGIGELFAVAFSPDGMTCAVGGEKGEVVIWDVDVE